MEERVSHEGWPRGAAVIGAGTMGLGVAECFAAAGVEVRLVDATPYDAQARVVVTRLHVPGLPAAVHIHSVVFESM